MSRIVLGVAGGIAAYKACELLRRLRDAGHDVVVVPTDNALKFVGAATWAALSGHPVATDVWSDVEQVPHVRLGQEADLVVVAPATADLLARAASGRADDLLTNVLLTAHCPVLLAPAMHTEMWLHPATVANVATLRHRGVVVLDPADGRLTGADSGPGRLPDAVEIAQVSLSLLEGAQATLDAVRARDLAGRHVVVSAGGTREQLDPVRFLGNSSSGLMGIALSRAAGLRGATVTLVAANIAVPVPTGSWLEVVQVTSTADLASAMQALASRADVIVMAAAPADFTPVERSERKLKKSGAAGLTLDLEQTIDVLKTLSADRAKAGQVIIGFAAETASDAEELLRLGAEKLHRKGCDVLVLNDVSGGAVFGEPRNAVIIIDADGVVLHSAADKNVVAHRILDAALGAHHKEN